MLETVLTTGVADPQDGGTILRCDPGQDYDADPPVLTHMFRIYDLDGTMADCVAAGHDPQGLIEGAYDRIKNRLTRTEVERCTIGVIAY